MIEKLMPSYQDVNFLKIYFKYSTILAKYFKNYFIVVQVQLSAFIPHHSPSTPAIPTFLPCFHNPLVLSMCPLQLFLKTLPPFYPLSPPISPLVTVSLFLISISLVIFCLLICFVDQVPVKGQMLCILKIVTFTLLQRLPQ